MLNAKNEPRQQGPRLVQRKKWHAKGYSRIGYHLHERLYAICRYFRKSRIQFEIDEPWGKHDLNRRSLEEELMLELKITEQATIAPARWRVFR